MKAFIKRTPAFLKFPSLLFTALRELVIIFLNSVLTTFSPVFIPLAKFVIILCPTLLNSLAALLAVFKELFIIAVMTFVKLPLLEFIPSIKFEIKAAPAVLNCPTLELTTFALFATILFIASATPPVLNIIPLTKLVINACPASKNLEFCDVTLLIALEMKEFIALEAALSELAKALTKLSIASVAIFLKPSLKLANTLESTPDISLIKFMIFLIPVTAELTTSGWTFDTNE